jgi:hypothetical protein
MQVLLDKFLSATNDDKLAAMVEAGQAFALRTPLDPLLQMLHDNFHTEEDLKRSILAVFQILDADEDHTLSNKEMIEGAFQLSVRECPLRGVPQRASLAGLCSIPQAPALVQAEATIDAIADLSSCPFLPSLPCSPSSADRLFEATADAQDHGQR